MATVVIGSARIDERGKAIGGTAGDQKQKQSPDYTGEVSLQKFYENVKGWFVLRAKDADIATRLAEAMKRACNNPFIGYNQAQRLDILKATTTSAEPTNCDCSSLVRECVIEASGKDPGNFTTANEVGALMATNLFDKSEYKHGMALYTGDILVTKTKGHTVIVTSGTARKWEESAKPTTSITDIAKEVIAGKWGNGTERKQKLTLAGYDYKKVQAEVNRLLKG